MSFLGWSPGAAPAERGMGPWLVAATEVTFPGPGTGSHNESPHRGFQEHPPDRI